MPCLWPRPERGRIIAARPGSAMWIARPVGISCACAGREHERRVEAGAQVEAGAAGGRVGRHLLGDARIEDLRTSIGVVMPVGAAAGGPRSRRPAGAPASACRRAAARARRARRPAVSALSSRPKVAGPRLPTISGTFLRASFSRACAQQVVALGGEADAERRLRQARDRGQDVGVLDQLEASARPCPAVLLDLRARRRRRRASRRPRRWRRRRRCARRRGSTASCISRARA